MGLTTDSGRVVRVNGPVVHLSGLDDVTRFEYVEVGHRRLPGEVLTVDHDQAVAELYEYTGGLTIGEPAWASGHPLTVELGPGLLGGIYDGLLRPLSNAEEFLEPRGLTRPPAAEHHFEPRAEVGDDLEPGDLIGIVRTADRLDHLVLVPPDLAGTLDQLAPAGSYDS
ncbi:MAG: hypothetical protein WBM50_13200, partial [Acidimicrobiales bacterium]